MGIYNQRKRVNKASHTKTKTMGLVFCAFAITCCLLTFIWSGFAKIAYSAFGYFVYGVYSVIFLIGFVKSSGRKYYINKAYLTVLSLMLFSLLCVGQIIWSIPVCKEINTLAQFGEYLSNLTAMASVGGVIFGCVTYPFIALLGLAGGIVVFAISTLVFSGFVLDFVLGVKDRNSYNKYAQRRNNSFSNEINEPDEITINFNEDEDLSVNAYQKTSNLDNSNYYSNSYKTETITNEEAEDEEDDEQFKASTNTSLFGNNFNFFPKDNLEKRLTNEEPENEPENEPIVTKRSSRDEARSLLFGSIENEDDVQEPINENRELTFDEKLKKLREEPVLPKFPDAFATNNTAIEQESPASVTAVNNTQSYNNDIFDFNNNNEYSSNQTDTSYTSRQTSSNPFARDRNVFDNTEKEPEEDNNLFKSTNRINSERISRAPSNDRLSARENARNTLFGDRSNESNRQPQIEQTRLSGPFMPEPKSMFTPMVKNDARYNSPPLSLLKVVSDDPSKYGGDYKKNSEILETTLSTFKINAKVVNVVRGPSVTRYEMAMPVGIPVRKVLNYESDLQAALCAKHGVRLEAPIPGKNAFGVELPNDPRSTVGFREIAESPEFNSSSCVLPVAIGKNINGEVVVKSLAKMVHTLIAGSTGSGKSIFLHNLIISLMFKESPEHLKFIMIDPKRVEFPIYNGMPHLMIPNVITDPDKAINAFSWTVKEMERRYQILEEAQVRDLPEYNKLEKVKNGTVKPMFYLILVVDELAELMSVAKKEIEEKIRRISQLGRACGIHLVIATQRPSTEIVTGTIKANLPTRVAFTLSNRFDSETILGEPGAEKLLGQGDMLFMPQDASTPTRLQGAFLTTAEIKEIIKYISENNSAEFNDDMEQFISKTKDNMPSDSENSVEQKSREEDELFKDALKYVIERKKASTSMLQTRFYIGFNRATRLIAQMENNNYIGPQTGAKPREVYITMEDFYNIYGTEE